MSLVTFFLPLPDVLGIADGTTLTYLTAETSPRLAGIGISPLEGQPPFPNPEGRNSVTLRVLLCEVTPSVVHDVDTLVAIGQETMWQPERKDVTTKPAGTPTVPRMVLQAATVLTGEVDTDALSHAFDECLSYVQRLQRAYAMVTGRFVDVVTRVKLPPFIPLYIRPLRGGDVSVSLFILHHGVPVADPVLSKEDLQSTIAAAQEGVEHHPIPVFFDLKNAAAISASRHGENRPAIVSAATACEVLLSELLLIALWEEGKSPADAAQVHARGLDTRIRTEYHGRFGGNWQTHGESEVASWAHQIAKPRNRILHGGYLPSNAETQAAMGAMAALTRFIADCLATPRTLRRYPVTALLVIGRRSLERRRMWSRRLQKLSTEHGRYLSEFSVWRSEVTPLLLAQYDGQSRSARATRGWFRRVALAWRRRITRVRSGDGGPHQ